MFTWKYAYNINNINFNFVLWTSYLCWEIEVVLLNVLWEFETKSSHPGTYDYISHLLSIQISDLLTGNAWVSFNSTTLRQRNCEQENRLKKEDPHKDTINLLSVWSRPLMLYWIPPKHLKYWMTAKSKYSMYGICFLTW